MLKYNKNIDYFSLTAISLESGDSPRHDSDDDERGVYTAPYRATTWLYVTPAEELKVL